jgi:hypothetical protein
LDTQNAARQTDKRILVFSWELRKEMKDAIDLLKKRRRFSSKSWVGNRDELPFPSLEETEKALNLK